jgi:23S rRNA (pseudouridine1915-N3)-methyltransferase
MLLKELRGILCLFLLGRMVSSLPLLLVSRLPRRSCRFLTTNILVVGKKNGAEPFVTAGCLEYEKRLQSTMTIQSTFFKTDDDLVAATKSLRGVAYALDEGGKELTSREFSKAVFKAFEEGGTHVTFIIGGFAGLPQEIKDKYPLVSLSRMTWTHQMARLLLLEQIYRAAEIHKGSSYHKD